MGMGMPLSWHRRHAMMLASQLPENPADAELVMEAMAELLHTFMARAPSPEPERAHNVLPFASG